MEGITSHLIANIEHSQLPHRGGLDTSYYKLYINNIMEHSEGANPSNCSLEGAYQQYS